MMRMMSGPTKTKMRRKTINFANEESLDKIEICAIMGLRPHHLRSGRSSRHSLVGKQYAVVEDSHNRSHS